MAQFDNWKGQVDNIVFKKIRFHLCDLPDQLYRDHYNDGTTYKAMANIVLYEFERQYDHLL